MSLLPIASEEAKLRQTVSDSQINARSAAAALTLLSFDILLTLNDEIKYVWRKPWSLPKTAYLVGRYFSLLNLLFIATSNAASNPSTSFCNAWKWIITIWIIFTSFAPCNIILGLRLDSLYSNYLRMRIILIVLFVAEVITHLTLLILYDTHLLSPSPANNPRLFVPNGLVGCILILDGDSFLFKITAIPNLVLTCIYLILAFQKFLEHLGERGDMQGLRTIRDSGRLASIFSLLFRDGIIVYAMIFVVVILNGIVLWSAPNRVIQGLGVPWLVAICPLGSSRLVLLLAGNPSSPIGIYKIEAEYNIPESHELAYELRPTIVGERRNTIYESKRGTTDMQKFVDLKRSSLEWGS